MATAAGRETIKFALIEGHPDSSKERLNRALADRYAGAAAAAGHEVRRIDVAALDFPLLRSAEEYDGGEAPPDIRQAQRDLAWADRIVLFYPLWVGDVPALLKGFIEQTFRPGFATAAGATKPFAPGELAGKSARIVVTMGMPAWFYRWKFGAHSVKALALNLNAIGIAPVRIALLGGLGNASEASCRKWLEQMAELARRDAQPRTPSGRRALVALGAAGALVAAPYLAYTALAWLRFGSPRRGDRLLDRVMPEYDVRSYHKICVGAPASRTFETLQRLRFDDSPLTRALFRAREVLLRTKPVPHTLPSGMLEQLEALGWSRVGTEPGSELVFGCVTKPWEASPVFESVPAADFARLRRPGFAKIAFSLRVDASGDASSIASTETRVQTADPAGRARFRLYWAFLSPGIELIRLALLRRLKEEAEARRELAPAY